MQKNQKVPLPVIDRYWPEHDAFLSPTSLTEVPGYSDTDLCCGQDGVVLLRNFSVQEAQNLFGRENVRTLLKCPTCNSYNFLAAAMQKLEDGSFVVVPWEK